MKYVILILCIVLFVACEEEVSVTEIEDYQPANTKVFISSFPSDAKIYIDGRYTGFNTPDTLTHLQTQSYLVSLKLKYYADYNFSIALKKDTLVSVDLDFFDLPNIKGELTVNSYPPKCKIKLDDQLIMEKTPATVSLNPGKYKLYFEADNCWLDSSDVEIYSGQTSVVRTSLVDSSNFVIYTVKNIGLPDNNARLVTTDKKGNVWGVVNALTIFSIKQSEVTSFEISDYGFDGYIKKILVDDNNDLWIATAMGLLKYDGITVVSCSGNDEPGMQFINDLFIDETGRIWVASNKGFGFVEGNSINWNNQPVEVQNKVIYSIFADNENIYLGGKNKLYQWDRNGVVKDFIVIEKKYQPRISQMNKGIDNTIWFTTAKLFGNDKTSDPGLPPKLFYFENKPMEIKSANENFTSIHRYKNYLIVASNQDLLFYQGKTLTNKLFLPYYFTQDYSLSVFEIYYDEVNQAIWLGTNKGLIKIKDHYLEGIL